MSLIFKNYSLAEAPYLLTRFNKSNPFLQNTRNTDTNSVYEQDTLHREKQIKVKIPKEVRICHLHFEESCFKGALNKFLTSMKNPVLIIYLHINGYLHCTNPSLFFIFMLNDSFI